MCFFYSQEETLKIIFIPQKERFIFLKILFVHFRAREREKSSTCMSGEGQREREKES